MRHIFALRCNSYKAETSLKSLLTYPRGGYGLTTGICDVGSLVNCLYGINSGRATMNIPDHCNQQRRRIFQDIVNPRTTANLKRVAQDVSFYDVEGIVNGDPFFRALKAAKADKGLATELRNVSYAHSFSTCGNNLTYCIGLNIALDVT